MDRIPYSEYLQYYSMRHHRWESVPVQDGSQKAYRFRFSRCSRVSDPRKVPLGNEKKFLAVFDESKLGSTHRQSSLFGQW